MTALEQRVIEHIQRLDETQQQQVLAFIQELEDEQQYPVLRLAKLPPDEQDRAIAEAFAQARNEDFETFEAYSEEPLDE